MQEKSYFKFGLYLRNEYAGNQTISESIFDADVYNQATRCSVNIKSMSHEIISSFQKTLSTKSQFLTLSTYVGKSKGNRRYYKHLKYNYNFDFPANMKEAFKFVLQINDNIIIERDFSVNWFNREAIFSNEIMELVEDWKERIQRHIKKNDELQMWEEQVLQERFGMQVQEIRALERGRRESMLSKANFR
jgi:gas vesicle protein